LHSSAIFHNNEERRGHAQRKKEKASQDGDTQKEEAPEEDASQEENPIARRHPARSGMLCFSFAAGVLIFRGILGIIHHIPTCISSQI
jgi:hypothetical protein